MKMPSVIPAFAGMTGVSPIADHSLFSAYFRKSIMTTPKTIRMTPMTWLIRVIVCVLQNRLM